MRIAKQTVLVHTSNGGARLVQVGEQIPEDAVEDTIPAGSWYDDEGGAPELDDSGALDLDPPPDLVEFNVDLVKGSVADVLARVDGDVQLAQEALDAELAGQGRKTLIADLRSVLGLV